MLVERCQFKLAARIEAPLRAVVFCRNLYLFTVSQCDVETVRTRDAHPGSVRAGAKRVETQSAPETYHST